MVERVDISALPAVKLLFGRADRVVVRMSEVVAQPERFADLLASTKAAGELDARAESVLVGPITLTGFRMSKDGDRLSLGAVLPAAALSSALPVDVGLRPVTAAGRLAGA